MSNSDVVVSKGVKRRPSLSRKQKIAGLIAAAAVLVLAASVFAFVRVRTDKADTRVDEAIASANASIEAGNYTDAENSLKAVENLPASKEQKLNIYTMLGNFAISRNVSSDVFNYYQKKHDLDSSTVKQDALTLGNYYYRLQQNDKAIEQYRIALEYLKTQKTGEGLDNINVNMDISAVQARLEELGVPQQ